MNNTSRFVYLAYFGKNSSPKPQTVQIHIEMARLNTEVRSRESPMDWQWQEGHGPTDTDSPFLKGAADGSWNKGSYAGQKRKS